MKNKYYGKMIWNNVRQDNSYPHVATWENFMGVHVPEGCCIHHIDGNTLNNDILNLVCMTRSDHQRWHYKHYSKETLDKLMSAHKSRIGTHHSEETRKKMSEHSRHKKSTNK